MYMIQTTKSLPKEKMAEVNPNRASAFCHFVWICFIILPYI